MAQVIWTEPALGYLDAIADYIAEDNADAANQLVRRVFAKADVLESFPEFGRRVPELRIPELEERRYREIVVRPCRVVYRLDGEAVVIIYVLRGEQELKPEDLAEIDP